VAKLCERPGCSEIGAAEYGMVPEDLLFWIAPMRGTPHADQNVLCRRHADAMSVPRGWTLDDRREEVPRLFIPARPRPAGAATRALARPRRVTPAADVEQLVIDGTGEIERPVHVEADNPADNPLDDPADDRPDEMAEPWRPEFDHGNDLDGLLEVSSPLLARAFRGTDRPRT
jgi:Protein of unknown function (DUF3499)